MGSHGLRKEKGPEASRISVGDSGGWSEASGLGRSGGWVSGWAVDWLGVFLVFYLVGASLVPGVNEPHYWTKSAHFWNPSFGRGDVFLESGDAHWLFFATWGSLTRWFSLPISVWVARLSLWLVLSAAWTWMMRGALGRESVAGKQPGMAWVATLTGAVWLAGMQWGHWAGEWVVGGAEAKVAAYAGIFAGLGCFFRRRWTWGWVWIGVATAFHVVTGIWVILCSLGIVLWVGKQESQSIGRAWGGRAADRAWFAGWCRQHGLGIGLCGLGVIVGMVPALWNDWGASGAAVAEASAKQVYSRLGHHLAPSLFSWERWRSFGMLLSMGCVVAGMLWHCRPLRERDGWGDADGGGENRVTQRGKVARAASVRAGEVCPGGESEWPLGLRWLLVNAGLALAVAGVGLLVDYGLGSIDRALSARILKYYWFRWNDVALPMAMAGGLAAMGYGVVTYRGDARTARWACLGLMVCVGALLIGTRFWEHSREWIPFGDRARLLSKKDDETQQRQQYRDWLEVCDWIVNNTDSEGLWLTPRNQQSFKWHTLRGELAAWKDMPQDANSVVEWAKRLEDAYPVDDQKALQPWTSERLWMLHQKYGIRYVLVDRRVPGQGPPLLPMLFPGVGSSNATFSVFEFPQGGSSIDPGMERLGGPRVEPEAVLRPAGPDGSATPEVRLPSGM